MTLDSVLATLHETAVREHFATHWDQAQATLPTSLPPFLRHDVICQAWNDGGFDQPLPAEVLGMADRIAGDPALLRLAWYAHWRLFVGPRTTQWNWPELRTPLGDDGTLFYLVVALGFIPAVQAYHATLHLPVEITRDTCRQVACYVLNHRRGHGGRVGVYRNQLGWLGNYMPSSIFLRIGRFEFWRRTYSGEYRVFRRAADGATVALAANGTRFTAQGDRCFDPAHPEPEGCWLATACETDEAFCGTPIAPNGRALPCTVRLPRAEWCCALQPGDTVLDMHIPSGGKMALDLCARSFREAEALFRTHFPDARARAISCSSWMFSNQLEECLFPETNLVRLLREVYLVPYPCQPDQGLWFVFLQDRIDLSTLPRETSLQRAILDYLATGPRWHMGGMVLLCDDISRVGTQPYRAAWPPVGIGLYRYSQLSNKSQTGASSNFFSQPPPQ